MFAYYPGKHYHLRSYNDALRVWQNADTWRGQKGEHDPRKLDGDKRHVSVRKGNNGQIMFRYHATDVVVFSKDGLCDVDCSWPSRSTNNFIWSIIGGGHDSFSVDSRQYTDHVAWVRGLGYLVSGNGATFDLNGDEPKLLNPKPINNYALKRDVTKQLREDYGVAEFKTWRAMTLAIKGEPDYGYRSWRHPGYRPNTLSPGIVVARLREGGEGWLSLVTECSYDYVLKSIYRVHPECVAVSERGPFTSHADYTNWRTLDAQYSWAV